MLIRNNWRKITHTFQRHKLDYLLVFLIILIVTSWLQASPFFLDTESFYHAGIIESMENSLTLDEFTWMQSTNYADGWADNNWLYHKLLSLFTVFLPTFLVIKLFGTLFIALLALYLYYWLKKYKAKWPLLFIVLLFSSQIFIKELNALDAEALSLLLLLLGLDFIINYKYWQLGVLAIILTTLSGEFVFLLVAAVCWLLVEFIYNRWNMDKFRTKLGNWRDFILRKLGLQDSMGRKKWLVLIFSGVGLFIGFLVHPYWPDSISFYGEQVLNNTVYSNASGVFINLGQLVIGAYGVIGTLLIGLLIVMYKRQKISKLSSNILLLMSLFLASTLIIEWGTTFFILLAAILTSLLFRDLLGSKTWEEIIRRNIHTKWFGKLIGVVVVCVIVFIPLRAYYAINKTVNHGYSLSYMQDSASWLYYNVPDSALVVNSDWQDWASLFYYNDNNNYWWGLNPNLMQNKYSQTAEDFVVMLEGADSRGPYTLLKSKFKADYILVNKGRSVFNNKLRSNIYFNLVYEDREAWIYKIQ